MLQRRRIAKQKSTAGGPTGADQNRGRRGQPKRAGAGNHQHGNSVDQPLSGMTAPRPSHPSGQSQRHHHWHEHPSNAISQPLDRRLGRLRRPHATDDAGEDRVAASGGRPQVQQRAGVERPRK